ncbi:MAG: alkaline phosphatase family protein [Candidatus Hodarchaeales archaeon]
MNRPKLLVIGLDGAEPSLLFKWVKERKLPNLGTLIKGGTSGNLSSTIPPMSPPAWAAFMTGKNPGKTGVFDFVQRLSSSYQATEFNPLLAANEGGIDLSVISANMIKHNKIWSLINSENKKVVVMHVPMTYPPDEVDGIFISGLGTPTQNSNFTYPPELREKLINEEYKMHASFIDIEGIEEVALEDLHKTEEKRAEIAIKLMKEYEWDFFTVVFEGTDYVQHFFWKHMDHNHPQHNPNNTKYKDAILNYYQKADELIGRILDNIPEDTTIIIMSDHGGGPINKRFVVNKWLNDIGLLNIQKKQMSNVIVGKFFRVLVGIFPQKIIQKIPEGIKGIFPNSRHTIKDVDWSRTKAFSIGGWGLIYINLKGREPQGIVEEREYEELRRFITEKLSEIVDPESGERCVTQVYKKEEIYSGEYLDQSPDLVFITENMECVDFIPKGNTQLFISTPPRRSGTHRKDGILIINGRFIKKNVKIHDASIIDLAPTILHILGISIPKDMDGKVLTDALNPRFIKDNPIKYQDAGKIETRQFALTSKEEEEIKKRLHGLGYLG